MGFRRSPRGCSQFLPTLHPIYPYPEPPLSGERSESTRLDGRYRFEAVTRFSFVCRAFCRQCRLISTTGRRVLHYLSPFRHPKVTISRTVSMDEQAFVKRSERALADASLILLYLRAYTYTHSCERNMSRYCAICFSRLFTEKYSKSSTSQILKIYCV